MELVKLEKKTLDLAPVFVNDNLNTKDYIPNLLLLAVTEVQIVAVV